MILKKIILSFAKQLFYNTYDLSKHFFYRTFFNDFSQAGETIFCRRFFRNQNTQKYFVEIGANDGITFSTSYGLVLENWAGIAVEPNPVVFQKLKKNLRRFPKIALEQVAISNVEKTVKLYLAKNDPKGLMSTISTDDSEWFRRVRSESFIEVSGISINNLLRKHEAPPSFELLLIDAEGMDYEILLGFDFKNFQPKLIVTENYEPTDIKKFNLLVQNGYSKIKAIGCNTFWAPKNIGL